MTQRPIFPAPNDLGPTITIGEILVEIMATTIGNGFLEPQPLIGPFASGAPAIFIDQVAKLGGQAGIIASVGNDDFGKLNIDRLQSDGVDVSAIAVQTDLPTGSAFVRYRADGGRDFVFNMGTSAAGRLALTDAAKALIARAGHLHIMGSAFSMAGVWDMTQYAAAIIRARGGTISLDPNLRKELMGDAALSQRLEEMLDMADLFMPSDEELFVASPGASEADAVAALFARGISEIVVKRGKSGASLYLPGSSTAVAAFLVEEVDPTGAGDCFSATYLTLRRLGYAPEAALDHAVAAGGRNVTRQGPMEGTSTLTDLIDFMATTKRHS